LSEGGPTGTMLSAWLDLHGITPPICRAILDLKPGRDGANAVALPAVGKGPDCNWAAIAEALCRWQPDCAATIRATTARTLTRFDPDPVKYPRPFTIANIGDGRPFVSVVWRGRVADQRALAHEFGHAWQLVASEGRFMPPILRETCAFLAEIHCMAGLPTEGAVQSDGAMWLDRLRTPERAAYDYDVNYPFALCLARSAATHPGAVQIDDLFSGRISTVGLVAILSEKG